MNNEIIFGDFVSSKNGLNFALKYSYKLEYLEKKKGLVYIFDIWEYGRENESKFSYMLRIMEDGISLKVVDLYPDFERYYLGKGISIAIILESSKIFNKRIISSSNNFKTKSSLGEFNSEKAIEKVWHRMMNMNLVEYDKINDVYFIK